MTLVPPGSTIGILGSGQLGRMLGVAAAQLGYRIHVFAPESGPACDIASEFTQGEYWDTESLASFAATCGVVTYEFENVRVEPLRAMTRVTTVHPWLRALETAQVRVSEKDCVARLGGRTAPYAAIGSLDDVEPALAKVGFPAILKTMRMGYDGKGQARVTTVAEAREAWRELGRKPCILEGFVTFSHEFSILLARGTDGTIASYPPPWNEHRGGILHRSSVPAPSEILAQAEEATALARKVAEAFTYVGVLALEFFATADGPVFNEMAPRVHNSGHWTIEGAETSQFENHIRAICGLPLGSTALAGARAEMENLIGDDAERWPALMAEPGAHLHLYGKHDIRPGRKMGHVTRVER
jgi:5-(carboxyamino)imidazole ribonucleotide synthase